MQCAISGEPPKQPVVSPKSGAVFEKTLVEAYINEHHKDPITSDPLALEDLIPLRASAYQQPRNATLNSVPSMLSALQNEWDAIALELFQLRKQLDDTRKELSTALYHHDAAVRVTARVMRERDEARRALQDLTTSISAGQPIAPPTTAGETQGPEPEPVPPKPSAAAKKAVPDHIVEELTRANEELRAVHKAQKLKPNIAVGAKLTKCNVSPDAWRHGNYYTSSSITPDKKIVVVNDHGHTVIWDPRTLKTERSTELEENPHIDCTAVTDTLQVAGMRSGQIIIHKKYIEAHKGSVNTILPHPSLEKYIISLDNSGEVVVLNIETQKVEYSVVTGHRASKAAIHPDGVLVAVAGIDGSIYIVDLVQGAVIGTYTSPSRTGVLTDVQFGSNGYWMFAVYDAHGDSHVDIWDLRKDTCSTVKLEHSTKKLILDKTSQVCICMGDIWLEAIQYSKATKSWAKIEIADPKPSESFRNGAIYDDSEPNQLKVAFVMESTCTLVNTFSAE